jgi:hypothetical protein
MGHRAGRYQEIIARPSMDYGKAALFIETTRNCQKACMKIRAEQVDQGIRHITPAMEESEQHKETDYV